MRNLKRALSLTLASVMLLGMMVVGSSAAAGYSDVAETDNVEAIEVLQAIGVMVGDDNGFRPGDSVNRAEMAVVMAKLLNLDYNYYSATCPFDDVYDWARGYVGACYANGIVSGRGEGIYDPGTTVTAVEAASMMLRALGYFKYQSDYADGFEVATVREGTKVGIFKGVGSSANTPLTRNQVAQMALNALRTGVVEPDGNTINMTTPDGSVITSKVNYVNVTSNKSFAAAISKVQATSVGSANDGYIVELGERLYDGKLKLDEDGLDVFGRPARKWEFDGKFVGAYAKKELMVKNHVGKVTGLELYELLGAGTIKDYDLFVAVDGVDDPAIVRGLSGADSLNSDYVFNKSDLNRNNKAAVGGTGTGVLMQVFVDHEKDHIYIAVINTYLARADKAYDAKKEEASIEIYNLDKDLSTGDLARDNGDGTVKIKLGKEDFALVESIAKNDPFLVTVADGEVQTLVPDEVLSAVTISAFKRNDYVVSGGTQYNYTKTASFKAGDLDIYTSEDNNTTNLKDRTYNIYLDAYGNLIGLEEVESVKNYVFLTGIDLNGSNLSNRTATANAIFTDGTVDTISINMIKSEWVNGIPAGDGDPVLNTWCTYTKSGDLYTVKEVYSTNVNAANYPGNGANDTKLAQYNQTNLSEITLKNGLRLKGTSAAGAFSNVYGDSNSSYLTAELGLVRNSGNDYGIIKGVEAVFTGIDGTSITVWDQTDAMTEANKDKSNNKIVAGDPLAWGIYTLYNNNGLVIASVVVGEGSSAKDLVYVTSADLSREEDNGGSVKAAGDGLWTFYREVVRNGETVMLTEVGDNVDALSRANMKQHEWYQVKLDGNGNVIKSEPAFSALTGRGVFEPDYNEINNTVEQTGVDTVLYQTDAGPNTMKGEIAGQFTHTGFGANDKLEVKGNNTLAVNTLVGSGIYFRNDVHVVLEYWNRNTQETDVMVGEGVDDLKDMVEFVNENSAAAIKKQGRRLANENYYVSALIEGGAATTIVIYDAYNNYERGTTTGGVRTLVFDRDEFGLNDFEFILNNETLTRSDFRFYTEGNQRLMELKVREGDYFTIRNLDDVFNPAVDGTVGNTWFDFNTRGNRVSFTVSEDSLLFENAIAFLLGTSVTNSTPVYTYSASATGYTAAEGTVTLSKTSGLNAGDTVTVTVTANTGYTAPASVSVSGGVGTVTLTGGVGSFNMPASNVVVTVTFTADDDNLDEYEEISRIQWNETTDLVTYRHKVTGEEIMKIEPHKDMTRMATVTLDMSKGSRVLLKTSKGVFADLLSMGSYFKLLEPLNRDAITGTTMADRDDPISVAAVTGEPTYADNKLNVVLGTPIQGGKLPESIVIDDTIQATVSWKDDKGQPVSGIPAEGADLSKFTYTLALTTVEGVTISGDVTVTTVDSKTYTVKGEDLDKVVNIDDKGVIEGGQAEEKTVTLTLKGGKAGGSNSLINTTTEELTVEVYNGNDFVAYEKVKTLSDGVTYIAKVTPGAKITLKGAAAVTSATAGNVIKVDGVNVTVGAEQKSLTFNMPQTDFTLDESKIADTAKVLIVDVKDGITGKWTAQGAATSTDLVAGENEVTENATVTITGTGSGTVVLVNELSIATDTLGSDSGVLNTAEATGTSAAVTTSITLRAGIEVDIKAENAEATINGEDVDSVSNGERLYVALGNKMIFANNTSTFNGFLANTKGGTALAGGAWVVAKPAGAEKATIYGGYTVKLNGVTAAYGESADKATTAVKSGDVVAAGQYVKATAPAGSVAVKFTKGEAIYDSDDKFTSGQIASGGLDLAKATEVGVFVGKVTNWGETKECSQTANNKTGLIYVLPNTYLKVDGSESSETPVVYIDDVASETDKAVDYAVVFQVGNKRIDVKLGEEEAVDAAAELAETIRGLVGDDDIGKCTVEGNTVYATGNFHYLGKPYDSEDVNPYRHSVAYEMQKFLGKLHDQKVGDVVKYPIVRYNGVDYTWGEFTVDGVESNGYQINGTTSLISVLVKDSAKVFPTYQAGTWTVELSVNGLPLNFVVEIIENFGLPVKSAG